MARLRWVKQMVPRGVEEGRVDIVGSWERAVSGGVLGPMLRRNLRRRKTRRGANGGTIRNHGDAMGTVQCPQATNRLVLR